MYYWIMINNYAHLVKVEKLKNGDFYAKNINKTFKRKQLFTSKKKALLSIRDNKK